MKIFIKKQKDLLIFSLFLLITIIVFKNFLTGHFATDSYRLMGIGYIKYIQEDFLPGGRIFSALLYYIAFLFKISYENLFTISLLGGLIISNIIFIKLKNICYSLKENWNWLELFILIIASYYTIFNAMYLENLYFAETIIMSLSVYFYLIAAKTFTEKKSNYFIKTTFFSCLGLFCYQGTISSFFSFIILLELLKSKKVKEVIKNIFFASISVGVAILINLIQIKITCNILGMQQGRLNFNLIVNFILGLEQSLNKFTNTFNNGYCFIMMILILFTAILGCEKKDKEKNKYFLGLIMILIVSIGAAIIPTLSTTSAIYSARIRFSIGACIGIAYLYLVVKSDIFDRNKIISSFLTIILIIYATINTYTYIINIKTSKEINILDIEETKKVVQYIEEYEEQNNKSVMYIVLYSDYKNSYKGFYSNMITEYSAMNWSALRTIWSSKEIIEFYGNRKLEKKEPKEDEIIEYLQNVDEYKNYYIIEDTLYITCYIH